LLVIAVIGKPGDIGMSEISPVIFPDHGNLGAEIFPVNVELREAYFFLAALSRRCLAQPSLISWRARPRASASAGTS
jgi:hypothetical protein